MAVHEMPFGNRHRFGSAGQCFVATGHASILGEREHGSEIVEQGIRNGKDDGQALADAAGPQPLCFGSDGADAGLDGPFERLGVPPAGAGVVPLSRATMA